jgi:hypothetical protein
VALLDNAAFYPEPGSLAAPPCHGRLRIAQAAMQLRIGKYLAGLHPKFDSVGFIDAANMATGFGGTGSLRPENGHLPAKGRRLFGRWSDWRH